MKNRKNLCTALLICFTVFGCFAVKNASVKTVKKQVSVPTGTTFTNPIMWADVPDLSVTRSGSDFYLISTTMHLMPGAPIMKSKDLVHWEPVSYVFDKLNDTPKYDLSEGTVYGRGQWASSIRYHKGRYYVLFSPNDDPHKAYIYTTANPSGKWEVLSRTPHFHDASLFFDDNDRVYVFSGTGSLRELKGDLSGVKPDGVNMKIFERDSEETGLLEGSQVVKHNGKYYLLMISWPQGKPRRQVCYRADKITGPYEKKVILEDKFNGFPYVGQGCIIDDDKGNWYGLVFQDRGGVGRVPLLMPVRWVDGWPMLGDENGKVPLTGQVPLKPYDSGKRIVESDDFSGVKLKITWQWNHNPINEAWSLTERPGYLRLKTNKVADNLYAAHNTITQRMEGPKCSGVVALDLTKMKDGDVAGFSAFNGHSGILAVKMEGSKKYLTMSTNVVDLDNQTKAILKVDVEERARVELAHNVVYLRIDGDFNQGKDLAAFYYSLDNKSWNSIGPEYKMIFDYKKFFMGSKFAIFNYATKASGGYIDVDFFRYQKMK
jgi:Beta-xylosidase